MNTPPNSASSESARPPVALIAGPTASGKSALAIALATAIDGVIINADASQVYADLSILSARPSTQDMQHAPHWLFGYIDSAHACSAAQWAADAKAKIAEAQTQGRTPILVGGSGLYIRTLLDGIAPIPAIEPSIREEARAMTVEAAYAALQSEDPVAAARLSPADTTRVIRALEVVRSTGQPLHYWQTRKEGGIGADISLRPLILLPPRDWLVERCDRRFEAMLKQGAVEEVKALLARNLAPELPVMRAIGVPEIAAWLRGDIDEKTLLDRGQIATRQYAKRQYTWFSRQPPCDWPRYSEPVDNKDMADIVIKFLI